MKRFLLIFITAVLLFSAISCTEKEESYDIDTADAARRFCEGLNFDDELVILSDEKAQTLYGFGAKNITVYAGSGSTAEMIVVAEYENPNQTAQGVQYINDYMAEKITIYSSYAPLEVEKLENAFVHGYGNFAVCIVTADDCDLQTFAENILKSYKK